jgi:hypothetical protein
MLTRASDDAYLGDVASVFQTGLSTAAVRGWVWVAVWLKVDQVTSRFYIQMWTKYGVAGTPIRNAGGWGLTQGNPDYYTFAEIRSQNIPGVFANQAAADAWVPSVDVTALRIGDGAGFDSPRLGFVGQYLTRAKAFQMDTAPTIPALDAIALREAADASAWGDWALTYKGTPSIQDRSGNSRHLSIQSGGGLYEGVPGPF